MFTLSLEARFSAVRFGTSDLIVAPEIILILQALADFVEKRLLTIQELNLGFIPLETDLLSLNFPDYYQRVSLVNVI